MKRSLPLMALSREHHAALVLAKKARALGSSTADAAAIEFMRGLPAIFASELAPHFRVEEEALLPALRRACTEAAIAAVERTLAEHVELIDLIRRAGEGDATSLAAFGARLEAHVRFEERELFPLAETLLPPETLAAALSTCR